MYVSMTGFGSATLERGWGAATLELSSVNHRYQEIYVRLPRELSSWEPWFHQKLRGLYRRGKVQVRVEVMWSAALLAVSINREVLSGYYYELREVGNSLGAGREISIDALVNLPGVLDMQDRARLAVGDETEEMLTELLCLGAKAWNGMRSTEGGHLYAEVNEHLRALEDHMTAIGDMWEGAKDAAFAAMLARIRTALGASNMSLPDESRLAQEAAIIADRWDISEELARLRSHVAKFREAGSSQESVGRKLDFLVQEMNREVNTINSKAADPDIRWRAVEAKTALERIREQIQNLE
ncbi:MAG: YicC family protein [Synergistaceae bacterium]|jgi:uncharacterized protein (TIGR00255 family)|nr:YicC family protein [Synergistaceae bacterium]